MAQVRRPTHTWSPVLEVDDMPIAYDTTLRHYHGEHAGLVVEALEQPLLLPKVIQVTQQVFVVEEWVKKLVQDARVKVEVQLGALKEKQAKMAEQLKEAGKERDSAEAGLKTTERQFEEVRKELHYSEINLATEKQIVTKLREELRKAREAAQLLKKATEAEKQAAYALGVQETQNRITEEFSAVARDYCDIIWGKAPDAAGIPAESSLRRPESIYYDSDICELPGPGSLRLEQPAQVSEAPIADQVPPAPVEVLTDSRQDAGQGKKVVAPQGKDKNQDKGKGKVSDTTISQSKQVVDPGAPKAQVQDISFSSIFIFFVYCFCIFFLLRKCTTLLLSMKICLFCFVSHDK